VQKRANQDSSKDFVTDQLVNGAKFRALKIVEFFTREALAIHVGQRLRDDNDVGVCKRLAVQRGSPAGILVDNGSECTGLLFEFWGHHTETQIGFSRPGMPTDNCYIETFNSSRDHECLNIHWFETIDEAKGKIEAWRVEYNESRPNQGLGELTLMEYAGKLVAKNAALGSINVGS
jgi:putative transposase